MASNIKYFAKSGFSFTFNKGPPLSITARDQTGRVFKKTDPPGVLPAVVDLVTETNLEVDQISNDSLNIIWANIGQASLPLLDASMGDILAIQLKEMELKAHQKELELETKLKAQQSEVAQLQQQLAGLQTKIQAQEEQLVSSMTFLPSLTLTHPPLGQGTIKASLVNTSLQSIVPQLQVIHDYEVATVRKTFFSNGDYGNLAVENLNSFLRETKQSSSLYIHKIIHAVSPGWYVHFVVECSDQPATEPSIYDKKLIQIAHMYSTGDYGDGAFGKLKKFINGPGINIHDIKYHIYPGWNVMITVEYWK